MGAWGGLQCERGVIRVTKMSFHLKIHVPIQVPFSCSVGGLFSFFIVFFAIQVFNLGEIQSKFRLLPFVLLVSYLKRLCLMQGHKDSLLYFFLRVL